MIDAFGNDLECAFLVPIGEDLPASFLRGGAEDESVLKAQSRPLPPDQFQVKGGTEEEETFPVCELFLGSGQDGSHFFARAGDPIRFFVDEFLDGRLARAHRRTDGEGTVTFDDQCDRFAPAAREFIDLNLHIKEKTRLHGFLCAEGEIWTPDQGLMSPLLYH